MSQSNSPITHIIKEERLAIAEATTILLSLIDVVATAIKEEVLHTENTPISKLEQREDSKRIQAEFVGSYMNTIRSDAPISRIFHPHNIQSWRVPEILVFKRGGFEVPAKSVAIAIPLSREGVLSIIYHEDKEISYPIQWRIGSVIYMAGRASVKSDGDGTTAFALLHFKMK